MMRRTLVGPSTKAVTHKFALVSSYLPPSWSGGAVVIGRLLQGIDQGQYCLISRENYEDYDDADGFIPRLASRYYCIPDQQRIPGGRFGSAIHWARSLWVVFRRGCRISRVLLQERCESVVVTTGDLLEFPAAFLASRLAGCRCFPYFFDDYTYQWWAEPRMVAMAAFFESFIIPRSAGVIVPNEFMEEEIKRRYRVPCSIVRNPCLSRDTPASSVPFPANPGEIRIIFTGAVYHLNYETFRNIMAAIELIDNPELRLHLYTAQPLEALSANGISGKHVVIHRHVPPQKVAMIQESADILLLPFSFASAAAPLVKTSATGKLAEYLASGRPVLANVADDSFLAWYLTKHECGMVVSSDDPAMLAKAFRRLIDDSELRNTITRNGLMRARIDFNPTDARNSFLRAMGLFQ